MSGRYTAAPGVLVRLTKNPAQIPIQKGGVTLVSSAKTTITLSTTEHFPTGRVYLLGATGSVPWTRGPLWGKCKTPTTLLVLQGLYNIK